MSRPLFKTFRTPNIELKPLLKTINNALKGIDEKSSLKKMLRAVWSRRKKQLNPIYIEISNFGKVTK